MVDNAWAMRGASVPGDPGAFLIKMPGVAGTAGENGIRIVVRAGTNQIITAYPVKIP